jgi:hypothetical protein
MNNQFIPQVRSAVFYHAPQLSWFETALFWRAAARLIASPAAWLFALQNEAALALNCCVTAHCDACGLYACGAQAVEIVKQAIEADQTGDYERALSLYKRSLEYFMTGLKYEQNPAAKATIMQVGLCFCAFFSA